MKRLFVVLFAVCAGCGEEEIRTYRIAKSVEDGGAPSSAPAAAAKSASKEALSWTAPGDWTELPASGMRKAAYRSPSGAETTVISLAGDGGGTLSNVNRWRGQIGLAPIGEAELAKLSRPADSKAGKLVVVDFSNGDKRMAAGILYFSGQAWYFKMTGGVNSVEADLPGLRSLLSSLRPSAA